MTEIKIVDVKLRPWWKRLLHVDIDNIEVVLEDERGNRKTVSIYDSLPISKSLLRVYIAKKYCTGDQFWTPPKPKEKKRKKPKMSREEKKQRLLMYAMEVVGESFDCALVMSEEG